MSSDSFVIDSFNYNGNFLITVVENNIPWFCRNDLARCIKTISRHYWDIYTEAKNKKKFKIKNNCAPFNFITEEAIRNILSGKYTNLLIDPKFIPWLESNVLPNLKINTNKETTSNENDIDDNDVISFSSMNLNNNSTTIDVDFSKLNFSKDDIYCENDTIYFRLSKIGEILNISSDALRKIRTKANWLDDDEIKVFDPRKNFQSLNSSTYVSESGFYQIIDHTNSPVAKPFRHYFVKVILPNYRTKVLQNNINGIFIPNFKDPIEAAKAWLGLAEKNKAIEERNREIEERSKEIEKRNEKIEKENKLIEEKK